MLLSVVLVPSATVIQHKDQCVIASKIMYDYKLKVKDFPLSVRRPLVENPFRMSRINLAPVQEDTCCKDQFSPSNGRLKHLSGIMFFQVHGVNNQQSQCVL